MTKGQVNVRISQATKNKLDWLSERHGTQTEAIAVAIDRLYQEEEQMATIFGHDPNCPRFKGVSYEDVK